MERRSFLKKAGLGALAFTILPRHVFGKMGGDNNFVAPSDQLTKGIIGLGGIGRSSNHFTSDAVWWHSVMWILDTLPRQGNWQSQNSASQ